MILRLPHPWLSVTGTVIFAACLGGFCLRTGAVDSAGASTNALLSAIGTNLPFKLAGPSLLELGKVRLDQNRRVVTLPAVVNLRDVNVEYLLVTSTGKTHESILSTDAEPLHLQLALLLLDAKGGGTNALPENPAEALPGETLEIEVTWNLAGVTNTLRAEHLVLDLKKNAPVAPGPWVFTGSRMREGAFAAQVDGSLISLITDPDALINNPRPGREDDDHWKPNATVLPPLKTPVEVTIRLFPVRN